MRSVLSSLSIVYTSTSGHTAYVVSRVQAWLTEHAKELSIATYLAENAQVSDIFAGQAVLFACGSWNTGGAEGQLSPFMDRLVTDLGPKIDLTGRPCAVIGLGDDRYRYRARSADHLEAFVASHGGTLVCPSLRLFNEPYGQEPLIDAWAAAFLSSLKALPSA